jgi:hypothetical protein
MIRSIRKTPLIRLSFQTFVLTISLANTFAQTGISVRNGRESALSALKQELLELERELVEYRMTEKEEPKSANSFPLIPKTPKPNITPSNRDTNRAESIHSLRTDLDAIENGLTTLKRTETDNFPGVKPDIEVITVRRKQVVLKHKPSKYFLFVNPGIAFAKDREYSQPKPNKSFLETRAGLELSIAFGGRMGPWTIGPEISYRRLRYKSISTPAIGLNTKTETGNSTSFSFALYSGRDIALSDQLNLNLGASLGVANAKETFTFTIPGFVYNATEEGSRFQGSIRAALEYRFSDLCSAHLGYKFSYVDDLGDFDSLFVNQAVLGLRLNL